MELRGRGPAPLGRAAGSRVLDVVEHPGQPAQAVLQPRGAGQGRRGPGREAERRDRPDARGGERAGGLRLRSRGPALRESVPGMRAARADLRRRRRGGEAADDGLHERRAGEDARVPPQRTGDIRACRRQGNMETMNQLRQLALLALICSPLRSPAQQWPVHSLDRPRPPVVDPGPERPPVPPPADAIVLFDGKDLGAWQSQDSTPAKWVVRNGYVEVAPHTGVIMTKRGFGDFQLHVEWAAPTPPKGESQERGNSGVFLMGHYEIQVLDTYHNDTYADGQAAAVYGQTPPLVNACRPPGQGAFVVTGTTVIVTDRATRPLGELLGDYLFPATGLRLAVRAAAPAGARVITLRLDPALTGLGAEGYRLDVTPGRITIRAPQPAGAFYAIQTLRQLLPPAIFRQARVPAAVWTISVVAIEDSPRFRWRGIHLDVARHCMP